MPAESRKMLPYAGNGRRFLAFLIDWALVVAGEIFVLFVLVLSLSSLAQVVSSLLLLFSGMLLVYAVDLSYRSVMTTYFGGTIGKLCVGLIVVDAEGNRITLKRSLFRHSIGYFISGLLFGLGYFWILRNAEHQGWHDQISETYVVEKETSALSVVLGCIVFFVLLLLMGYWISQIYYSLVGNLALHSQVGEFIRILSNTLSETK